MLDHHIQRSIVYRLALARKLKFTELKPDILDNKLFTYHLKKVISAGFALKDVDGYYKLTPEGRRLGAHVLDNTEALVDRAYSVLFLAIQEQATNKWLLYKRKTHPLIDRVGFMHTTPNADESILKTAAKALKEKTSLEANFQIAASGFFRIYDQDKLESFTNFTLLKAKKVNGKLLQKDPHAEYFWVDELNPDLSEMLPNMKALYEALKSDSPTFIEKKLKF